MLLAMLLFMMTGSVPLHFKKDIFLHLLQLLLHLTGAKVLSCLRSCSSAVYCVRRLEFLGCPERNSEAWGLGGDWFEVPVNPPASSFLSLSSSCVSLISFGGFANISTATKLYIKSETRSESSFFVLKATGRLVCGLLL